MVLTMTSSQDAATLLRLSPDPSEASTALNAEISVLHNMGEQLQKLLD